MGFNSGFKGLKPFKIWRRLFDKKKSHVYVHLYKNRHCSNKYFVLFVPCIFSTYGMKTNWCHYFIRILLDLCKFRAHRPIFRRVRTAVHTTIGSYSICTALVACSVCCAHTFKQVTTYRTRDQNGTDTVRTNGYVHSCTNSPEDGPVGPKHVEIQ